MEENPTGHTEMSRKFTDILASKNSKSNSATLSKKQYDSLLEDVRRIKSCKKKETPRDYKILQRYDIRTVQGCEKLIEPVTDPKQIVKRFVHMEELFDVLYSAHLSTGHGGRERMKKKLRHDYVNITIEQIRTFLDLCETCQEKQRKSKKDGTVANQIISSQFSSRCQINLIDFHSQPDGKFTFLLVYQDQLTKFVVLKPLASKRADEVANNILDIFLLLGAPCILQSVSDREFFSQVLMIVKEMWPELRMVHGKAGHSQSLGSIARVNQDIKNMLTTWMIDNNTNKWSQGVRFVQFMKNRSFHSGIKTSPFEALFGCPARVGLASTCLPADVQQRLVNEEDLEKLGVSHEDPTSEDMNVCSTSKCQDLEDYTCSVCSKNTSNTHNCASCKMVIHFNCGVIHDEQFICKTCKNKLEQTNGEQTIEIIKIQTHYPQHQYNYEQHYNC